MTAALRRSLLALATRAAPMTAADRFWPGEPAQHVRWQLALR